MTPLSPISPSRVAQGPEPRSLGLRKGVDGERVGSLLWHKVMPGLYPYPEHLPGPAWWHLWPILELEQVAPEVKVISPVLPPAEWFGASHSTSLGLAFITIPAASKHF